jgi:signal transduction histidine kinase/CheY-like chemotaxis protein
VRVFDELKPGRDFIITAAVCAIAGMAIFAAPGPGFPVLHTILNTGIALFTVVLALLFWDLGWRTGAPVVQFLAILFAITGVLEILHVLAALEPSSASEPLNDLMRRLRSGTWAPPAYLLPLGIGLLLRMGSTPRASRLTFGVVTCAVAVGLFVLFQWLPRYTAPVGFGIIRPSLAFVPLLWIPVAVAWWRRRGTDRLAPPLAWFAIGMALAQLLMLYSDEATSKFAMSAHFGVFACGLFLLLSVIQMGTRDTARRMRAEQELRMINETLEARVAERTVALESANGDLRREVGVRQQAESKALVQLERFDLLRRITHAIAERQDLDSIFQVVVRSVEEHLPAEFVALCNYERTRGILTVSRIGVRNASLAHDLAMSERSPIEMGQNGLSPCFAGQLVYEPDITALRFPFPQRLVRGGMKSLVIVPLMVEERSVFGVLMVARREIAAFSSGECEFLRQLCDHVSLAANQAQLHESLRQAYEDLRLTQDAVLEHERLRALGQMASGIAHDINNAISPASLYVESILTHETGFSERTRKQLEVVQRAVDDVAQTVKRMGEFYRLTPTHTELHPVEIMRVLGEVLELTRARWSDMAQQRGIVIETKIEGAAENPVAMAIESELREALVNLVLNATDAMPAGGELTLRCGYAPESGRGIARRIFIEVSDTGIGMDENTRRHCLEPFFTTKGERGSGLGLAMVYGIAQRHGIDLEIVSALGAGTTFRLVFPHSEPAPQSASVRILKIPRHTKILIVDDDPVLLTSLREVLLRDGHQVQTANGGKAGIDAFLDAQKAGEPFPVVITDLGMPHVDGRAVVAAVKAAAPKTAILLLTGWGQRLIGTGEVPPEVHAVLSKPPRITELRQRLAEITDAEPDQ